MTTTDPLNWFKSSYSGNGGQCLEVAATLAATSGVVPVRDSKAPAGPVLVVSLDAWSAFVAMATDAQI